MKTMNLEGMENVEGGRSAWGCAVGWLAVGSVVTVAAVAVVGTGGAAAAGAALIAGGGFRAASIFAGGVAAIYESC